MLRKQVLFCLLFIFVFTSLFAQGALLKSYQFNSRDTVGYYGLGSNGVTQIKPGGDSILWLGTGAGLSWVEKENFQDSIFTYFPGFEKLPRGGISAIETSGSTIWVAAVFDSSTTQGELQTGGGLAYSLNGGISWTGVAQPLDARDDKYDIWNGDTIRFSPVTTPVQNTTWDIAIDGNKVYTVSWAGGLRRTTDNGETWERIPLPGDEEDTLIIGVDEINYQMDPLDHQNLRGFSVLARNDTLWVGTARGINKGIIQGETIEWYHYSARRIKGLSGDFVVALHRQEYQGREVIWAVTLTAGTGETQGVSYTPDGGKTWHTTLENHRGYDIASRGEDVFIGTQSSLYKLSPDRSNWSEYDRIYDEETNNEILTDEVYSLFSDDQYLWVGTGDGLARLNPSDNKWSIYHESASTEQPGETKIYAYPNPFYPNHNNVRNGSGHVRVKFHTQSQAEVWLEVYDFAMDRVYKGSKQQFAIGDGFIVWDGRMDNGELVANGAYFCKLTKKTDSGTQSHWTKLLILK